MTSQTRWLVASALFAMALAVRLWRIDWGLPGVYEEGFALERAWGFWNWGGSGFDWNPHWFNYPTLYSYMQFVVQWLVGTIGPYADAESFRAAFTESRAGLVLPGRLLSALLGALTAPLVFLAALRFAAPVGALLAGLIVMVHSVHVEKSRFLEVDVPSAFFIAVAFVFLSLFLAKGKKYALLIAAAAVGLAASTKYPAGVFLVNVMVAPWAIVAPSSRRRVALTLMVGLAALLSFLAGTPYALFDFGTFLEGFRFEGLHVQVGHLGGEGTGIVGAAGAFSSGYGPILAALVIVAACYLIARRPRDAAVILPGVFALFALLAFSNVQPAHYAIPALPAAAISVGILWSAFAPRLPRYTAYSLFAILLLWPASAVHDRAMLLGETDSRTEALRWIEQKIAPGRIVLTEAHGPQLLSWEGADGAAVDRAQSSDGETRPRFRLLTMPLFPVEPNRADRFYDSVFMQSADLLVTVGAVRERYEAEPDRFPRQVALYRELEGNWIPLHTFPAAGLGSPIRLFGRPVAGRVAADDQSALRFAEEARNDREFSQFARSVTQYLLDRERDVEALRLAESLAGFAPDFAANRALHATILSASEPDRALAILRQSHFQNPGDPAIAKNLAIASFQSGDFGAGIAVLEAVITRGVEDAEIHGNLANAYLMSGDDKKALQHFRRFLAIDPAHPRAREIEQRIRDLSLPR